MSQILKTVPRIQACARQIATTSIVRSMDKGIKMDNTKIKEAQKKFQCDNGVPIFLKGGTLDMILYRITMAGCIGGVAWATVVIAKLAM